MGDLVYFGSCSGVFYALERDSGKVRWSHDTALDGQAANFHGDPLVTDEIIVVGSDATDRGHLYAFDLETGRIRWRRPEGRGVPSGVLRRGRHAYALTVEDTLLCVDLKTGETIWRVPMEGDSPPRLRSSLLLHRDRVLFATSDGAVRAVDASSGENVWRTDLGAPANTGLVRLGDGLFVGTLDERVLHLSSADGTVRGSLLPGGLPFGTPLVTDGAMFFLISPGSVVRLDADLEVVWFGMTDAEPSTFRPLRSADSVLVGDESGRLHAFRLKDGLPGPTLVFDGTPRGLGASGDELYVGTLQGAVYAYRP